MTNEKILKMFLVKHRKYTSFLRQKDKERLKSFCIDWCNSPPKKILIKHIITNNFIWSQTKEGTLYWYRIDKEWKKLCTDFKLEGYIDIEKLRV